MRIGLQIRNSANETLNRMFVSVNFGKISQEIENYNLKEATIRWKHLI